MLSQENILFEKFKQSQKISGGLFYSFLKSKNVFKNIKTPTSLERLLYELKWNDRSFEIAKHILVFLQHFGVTNYVGETVTLGENVDYFEREENRIELHSDSTNPVYRFVKYGLDLFDEVIEGGVGLWDDNKHMYTYENGLMFPIFQILQSEFMEKIREVALKQSLPKILLIGQFAEWFIAPIASLIEEPKQVTIYIPQESDRDRSIAHLEVDRRTSKFSNQVVTNESLLEKDHYDIIFCFNGFDVSQAPLSDIVNKIKSWLKIEGQLICHYPSEDVVGSGIEPMQLFYPRMLKMLSIKEFENFLKVSGLRKIPTNIKLPIIIAAEKPINTN